MRGFMGYMLIGILAVMAMGLVTIAGVGFAVGARPVTERGAVVQHVDRTHKGDRLDMRTTLSSRPVAKKKATAAPVGCEPAFSPLVAPDHPHMSGRCIS